MFLLFLTESMGPDKGLEESGVLVYILFSSLHQLCADKEEGQGGQKWTP